MMDQVDNDERTMMGEGGAAGCKQSYWGLGLHPSAQDTYKLDGSSYISSVSIMLFRI